MTTVRRRAFITRGGVVACVGHGERALRDALLNPPSDRFAPPTVIPIPEGSVPYPVGEVPNGPHDIAAAVDAPGGGEPRTHRFALEAAREALGSQGADAIVVGTTTAGIAASEQALVAGSRDPEHFRFHGLDTVAAMLAERLGIDGLAITVSTACSSSAVAIAIGRELIRCGLAGRVLSGGADALCRLTYHGFRELRLLSPGPSQPLDVRRAGVTLGEGAAFVVLDSQPPPGPEPLCELCGAGMSCDAHHATKPHPEAVGAACAMRDALADAGIPPEEIDYVNLHGTGTVDNDATEAIAVRTIFPNVRPAVSSTKGLTGHLLGAAGAIETLVAVAAIRDGIVPGNFGLEQPDPALALAASPCTTAARVRAVVSNSFGFGGNNASLVVRAVTSGGRDPASQPQASQPQASQPHAPQDGRGVSTFGVDAVGDALPSMRVLSTAVATAAGDRSATWQAFVDGRPVRGTAKDDAFDSHVPMAQRRRSKRLARLVVGLGCRVQAEARRSVPPDIVSTGTAWGSLDDTYDYVIKLSASGDRFGSPADFVGSVHNGPAAQLAIALGAPGPNITCSSGDRSFEHAVLAASLLDRGVRCSVLLVGADTWHETLSPLIDPAGAADGPTDGGAAVLAELDGGEEGIRLRFLGEQRETVSRGCQPAASGGPGGAGRSAWDRMLAQLGGLERVCQRYGSILVGVPARQRASGSEQLDTIVRGLGGRVPVRECRPQLGEHASTSAVACVMAIHMVETGRARAVLLLTLGNWITAMEVVQP